MSYSPMLPAKFFAVLALFFATCAGLAWLNPWSAFDLYVHGSYFVFSTAHVLLFCAVTSVNFAVLYYAAVRIFNVRWNRTLSFLHIFFFVCFGISLSLVFGMSSRLTNAPGNPGSLRWMVIPWFVGIVSFVISFGMFGVHLTLIVVQLLRARFASR